MSTTTGNRQPNEDDLQKEIAAWELPLSPDVLEAMRRATPDKDPAIGEDQGVGNNVSNDGSKLPELPKELEKFGTWLGVAATLNRKAYEVSTFDPASPTYDEDSWNSYSAKFKTLPFWHNSTNKRRDASITELSLSPLIGAISNLVEGFVTKTGFEDIVTSVKKIAELAVNNRDQTQKDSYEQVGLITILKGELYVANTRTVVHFTYHEGKGYQQLKQNLVIQSTIASLDFQKCARSADKILAWDQSDVDAWVTKTASNPQAPNESPAWDN